MNRTALLIPHYNNPVGVNTSLASIGVDEAVDVYVVDDGSTRTPLDEAAARAAFRAQGTLHLLYLPQNRGIEHALNTGLQAIVDAGYDYCARLDCDDRVAADRFARQQAYMDTHPQVALLGSAVTFFDASGDRFTLHQPQSHAEIVRQMHDDNAFTHPAVMFRVAAVQEIGLYPVDTPAAEDFAYFWHFVARYQTANLPDVLTWSEYNDSGISLSRRRRQQWSRFKVLARHFDWAPRSLLMLAKPLVWQVLPFGVVRAVRQVLGGGKWS
ncbi:UDP-Gal:alpha-D-GlcNAc-diphosphoundecaprenol beta-1,3-galactosyltransferase [Andreprevotia sp. IGB-42]|uniref:glycosyltransferase family 2 protein n=1 Tax=Andreprevotia sp. IGB-42 TaxID=2497473 RepID=UPI00135B322F|nr:glycosyltransferase family 2 protein [Andreprevotia sp. IGB-42]KAF0814543.1 UDP-Gal:alpha-D-GlcNAc-diphosphoundecaprenol beta-1,3-galactosyltransferase [Andreprevotia sp. IGB-42]